MVQPQWRISPAIAWRSRIRSESATTEAVDVNLDQMRQALAAMYNGEKWRQKVANMSAEQVVAVYSRKTLEDNRK